jgi:hypothetical protein
VRVFRAAPALPHRERSRWGRFSSDGSGFERVLPKKGPAMRKVPLDSALAGDEETRSPLLFKRKCNRLKKIALAPKIVMTFSHDATAISELTGHLMNAYAEVASGKSA